MTIRAPYGGGVRAPELHSDGFEAVFAQMPGLKMVAPSTAADAKGMLLSAIRDPDPVLFLEPLRGYRLVRDEVPDGDVTVDLGVGPHGAPRRPTSPSSPGARWRSSPSRPPRPSLRTASTSRYSTCDRWCRSTSPPSPSRSAAPGGRSSSRRRRSPAGFASEVVAAAQEGAFLSLQAPIARVSGWDVPYPMPLVEDYYVPSVERVVAAIRRTVEF